MMIPKFLEGFFLKKKMPTLRRLGAYMQNRTILFIFGISLFMVCSKSNAQYGNVWAFGRNAGIDFNSTPPKAIKTNIEAAEGCASISDATGRLLFYTDGTTVWDRNHTIMPNGKDLPGLGVNITASTMQGTLIVPVPAKEDQYYVFSLGCFECGMYSGNLYYSIIDMHLNNGRGDAVSGAKGILLDKGLTEHMTAVSGGNCDIWLLVLDRMHSDLKAYNISSDGIDTDAVVTVGLTKSRNAAGGTIDVSPDRKKVAIASGTSTVLGDFDAASGRILNPWEPLKRTSEYFYGVSFSPDNTKLYITSAERLYQMDLSLIDTTAIIASKTLLGKNSYGTLQRGPDGKIYCAVLFGTSIGVIKQPNLTGVACNYAPEGLTLMAGTTCSFGLSNSATILSHKKIYNTYADTADCADSMLLQPDYSGGSNYRWNDGRRDQDRYVYHTGGYWVTYHQVLPQQCYEYADTFNVVINNIKKVYSTTNFDGLCAADTFLMQAGNLERSNYIWNDGEMGKYRKVNQTGTYWVSYKSDSICESYADTFNITYPKKDYEVSFIADTLICAQDTISFQNTSAAPFNRFSWDWGDGHLSSDKNSSHYYPDSGTYQVQLIGKIGDVCPDTAYATLVVDPVIPVGFLTDHDSVCMGSPIIFSYQLNSPTITQLLWDFGDNTRQDGMGQEYMQHAYDQAGMAIPVSLTAYFRSCPEKVSRDTLFVAALPVVDLGPDSSLCGSGGSLILYNRNSGIEWGSRYQWNTQDTAEQLKVVDPGTYSLTVRTEPLGCSTTDIIVVRKDCYLDIPNAFTPDGDGYNDYFFPRQLLSKGVSKFQMLVFNRWGQIVFETHSLDGRGWDGRFNGEEQSGGVYIYMINVELEYGKNERYDGNLTLLK